MIKYYFIFILYILAATSIYGIPQDIQFENEVYDFGKVEAGSTVYYNYVFRNTGTALLTINNVRPSCGCTVVSDWDKEVPPGGRGSIPVSFEAPVMNGKIIKVIFVKTGIKDRGTIQLTLKGAVYIPTEIVPLSTWLGEIKEGNESLEGSVSIINHTEIPLEIIKIIPPEMNITYNLSTIEKNKRYKLDFTINPPYEGEKTVEQLFLLKTNRKKDLELKFFYLILPNKKE